MLKETELIAKSRLYAEETLGNLPVEFTYHNLNHTQEVVAAVTEIGSHSKLSKEELEIAVLAAWFHDVGYKCGVENHEQESALMMREKMTEWKVQEEKIAVIESIIKSTKMPQSPNNEAERVMCDADLYHLSTDKFINRSEELRQELIQVCNQDINAKDWTENNIRFLTQHEYFTPYGKKVLEPRKKDNLKQLLKKNNKNGDGFIISMIAFVIAMIFFPASH